MKPKPKIREADVLKTCLDYLRMKNILCYRINVQGIPLHGKHEGRFRPPPNRGLPDILCILKPQGVALALEIKSATGKLSPYQQVVQRDWINAGAQYLVIRNVEELISFLTQVP